MGRRLHFDEMPSLVRLYLQAALKRKRMPKGSFEPRIPPIEAAIDGVRPDSDIISRYRQVCAFGQSDGLALPFPHVLATPLHAAMVAHAEFPYPVLGVIHVRQVITLYQPIATVDRLSVACRFGDEREARQGIEFDTVTEARVAGELAWEGISTALVRDGRKREPGKKPASREAAHYADREQWRVPADMGRRYARVTNDWNPIHLYPLTARPFGFRAPIVHGMWSLARCVAALEAQLPAPPIRLEVSFKRPIKLPSTVAFASTRDDDGVKFELQDPDGQRPHLIGTITRALG